MTNNYKFARVDIYLGQTIFGSQIAIDGITRPYKSVEISLDCENIYPRLRLTRNIGNDGIVTDELIENPIVEYIEAHPLITHARFEDLPKWKLDRKKFMWMKRTPYEYP